MEIQMIRRALLATAAAVVIMFAFDQSEAAAQYPGYGPAGSQYNMNDWDRLYHYPYVYYPQNFYGNEYYRSAQSLYYRYPQEMRTPVYNKAWQNYYPSNRRYHWGHQFVLDVF
jgi:hypothetical protein